MNENRDIILQTFKLTKKYGANTAVAQMDMTVRRGDIYGFVGLNGSGKTTLIRLVTSLIMPSSGSFSLFGGKGKENSNNLRRISSMVETPSLYLNLDARTNLLLQCDFCGISDSCLPDKLLELVGLYNVGKKKVKNFSLGMKQRLGIAVCLVGSPEFLILDEPTNGLDPEGIVEIRELLRRLNKDLGLTILVSSHILSELDKLATTFGFIHKGKLLKEVTSEEIHGRVESKIVAEVDNLSRAAEVLEGKCACRIDGGKIEIFSDEALSDIIGVLAGGGVKVYTANKISQDLESYFMSLIGGQN